MRPPNLLKEAYLLEAQINYTNIYFADGSKEISPYTLKKFEQQLASNPSFIRIHRSFLVNKNFIREIKHLNVVLISGAILPLARRRRKI
ncbi:LytR/AlgR family response regulator transcription factor [Emticicia sp. SJ17W-69]|uniref:LytR/AlgR family response regulator transcription factor n=1 Tax=Emticicia sp. SJ17W-69 TaxID=3421657 RepID=UPI003EBB0130